MIEESIKLRALRRGEWKFIPAQPEFSWGPKEPELYKLSEDPGENRNVYEQHSKIAESMANELETLLNSKSIKN